MMNLVVSNYPFNCQRLLDLCLFFGIVLLVNLFFWWQVMKTFWSPCLGTYFLSLVIFWESAVCITVICKRKIFLWAKIFCRSWVCRHSHVMQTLSHLTFFLGNNTWNCGDISHLGKTRIRIGWTKINWG